MHDWQKAWDAAGDSTCQLEVYETAAFVRIRLSHLEADWKRM